MNNDFWFWFTRPFAELMAGIFIFAAAMIVVVVVFAVHHVYTVKLGLGRRNREMQDEIIENLSRSPHGDFQLGVRIAGLSNNEKERLFNRSVEHLIRKGEVERYEEDGKWMLRLTDDE